MPTAVTAGGREARTAAARVAAVKLVVAYRPPFEATSLRAIGAAGAYAVSATRYSFRSKPAEAFATRTRGAAAKASAPAGGELGGAGAPGGVFTRRPRVLKARLVATPHPGN